MNRHTPHHRPGIILLVVISSLAFFSILIATYLVYSRDASRSSHVLASRNYRTPDIKDLFDESLMMFVRGTDDINSPFFGEDLLSDYYGRRHGYTLQVRRRNAAGGDIFRHVGGGHVRFAVNWGTTTRPVTDDERWDDMFAGRLITFTAGPLQNKTFRVLRSRVVQDNVGTPEWTDVFYIHLDSSITLSNATGDQANVINALHPYFYSTENIPANAAVHGYTFRLNGIPRSSPGIGFDGTAINQTIGPLLSPMPPAWGGQRLGISSLPVALQPNSIAGIETINKSQFGGDFNEDYDAADFNNWFLSYRNADGSIVPSFHRPATLNYILNQTNWSTATSLQFRQGLASLYRATFRPLPVAAHQFALNVPAQPINERFTGSSSHYALRSPLFPSGIVQPNDLDDPVEDPARQRLNQLARALVADPSNPENQWDVDNDGDGVKDSIWVDIDLPVFTSAEGRLLKPLVAPMIEDLSARLNVNAHGNVTTLTDSEALRTELANWAGTRSVFGNAGNRLDVFRGLGFGPAEIGIPAIPTDTSITLPAGTAGQLKSIITDRYNSRYGVSVPGRPGGDPLDVLRSGWRPPLHSASGGYGYSLDPFGRGGVAIDRSGGLVSAVSGRNVALGTAFPADRVDEALNDPYESDPTGRLSGDTNYSYAELEPLLRSRDFDLEMLPQRLRTRLAALLEVDPAFAHVLTTHSKSDDSPIVANGDGASVSLRLQREIRDTFGTSLTAAQINQLLAPELRLGRKMDINRPFGNGVDDTPAGVNGRGTIDEPREVAPGVLLPTTPGAPLSAAPDQFGPYEQQAFGVYPGSGQQVPAAFQDVQPRYNIVQSEDETQFDPANPAAIYPFDIERDGSGNSLGRQVTGRQLLARHLYVMMMWLTHGYTFPAWGQTFDPPVEVSDPAFFKARRIAQWAVNVVDYRDNDSIMTRFVFDPTPFDGNGWSPPAEPAPAQNVVWGVEAPELMFSESLALHDVRVRNTDAGELKPDPDADPPNPTHTDENTDQVRKPEGSLFLELYSPRPQVNGVLAGDGTADQTTKPAIHAELHEFLANGVAELDLDRSAPPRSGNASDPGAPVWRIAISERHDAGTAKEDVNPRLLRTDLPDSYSFDPQQPNELEPAPPLADQLQFERYIWFRDFADAAAIDAVINVNQIRGNGTNLMARHEVFFAPSRDLRENKAINQMRQLAPGQYLTIAPREVTHLGSRLNGGGYPNSPSAQRFVVMTNPISQQGLIHFDHTSDLDLDLSEAIDPAEVGRLTPLLAGDDTHHTSALPLIVGAFPPTGWNANVFEDGFIGLNVSEPLADAYYPTPQYRLNGTTGEAAEPFPLHDSYIDYTQTGSTSALDEPVDLDFDWIPHDGVEPTLGTVPDYCTAFLQRLADPTVPYDPVLNPYRTVDSITIDLTVFSGEEEPDTVNPGHGAGAHYAQRSRQRNGHIGAAQANALFSYETNEPFSEKRDIEVPPTGDFFGLTPPNLATPDRHLYTSLSFLNTDTTQTAGDPDLPAAHLPAAQQRSNPDFVGFASSIGSEADAANGVRGHDRNAPTVPFALHPWLNRPFASHFELMLVPASSQGRLFEEFSINLTGGDAPVFPLLAPDATEAATFYAPFRHLLNFFHSRRTGGADAANFVRLFDFVHTLPRFNGEVEMIPPAALNLAGAAPGGASNDAFFRAPLRPPFNLDYDNQRVGQINLNTVAQFPVWAGLMQGHLNASEFTIPAGTASQDQLSFNQFLESRRGYAVPTSPPPPPPTATVVSGTPGGINYDPGNLDPRFPSQFIGMYRDAMASVFAPGLADPTATEMMRRREGNATLLRMKGPASASDPTGGSPAAVAAFVRGQGQSPNALHLNRERNAFTRYQSLMRMPNLVSDNSQLYLLRLTMGFFEFDATTQSLGQEYNEDSGQNKRYRAMYIIDRSKEVGFIPGQDLNARDVVVFESYQQ